MEKVKLFLIQLKHSKLTKFLINEGVLKIFLIAFIVGLVISLIFLRKAEKTMMEYTKQYATQKAFDSIQALNLRKIDSFRIKSEELQRQVDGLYQREQYFKEEYIKEIKRFNLYKQSQYEKINSLVNIPDSILKRKYAEFKELE